MAGTHKEPGPTAQRVAANMRRIRHGERDITTAEVARRLKAIGQPIGDTGITKAEKLDRRVDVDDLVPLALALGVTPNVLLMPPVDYFGGEETHQLTPEVSGTALELWQWAQGERAIPVPAPGAIGWLGNSEFPLSEFPLRARPYLTAPRPPGADEPDMRELTSAVLKARKAGAGVTEIRRAVELTLSLPTVLRVPEFRERVRPGWPRGEGS